MSEGGEKKVYVGNLSYGTTDEGLRLHFQSIGDIEDGKEATVNYHSSKWRWLAGTSGGHYTEPRSGQVNIQR